MNILNWESSLTSRKLPEFSAMQYKTNKSARDLSTLRTFKLTPDSFSIDSNTYITITQLL